MRAIIFGCGRMGRVRAASLHDLGVGIAAVYDPDGARAVEVARSVGADCILTSAAEPLPTADLAFVCTPPDSHVPLGLRAAQSGMSIFIEKPLALSLDDVLPLADAVRRLGLICAVGNMNRLRPSVTALRGRFASAGLFAVAAHWVGGPYRVPWWGDAARSGGGFNEQGVHVVDLLAYLAGPVREVSAMRSADGEKADPSAISIAFRHRSGCVSSFTYSYRSSERSIELNFFSTAGSARLSGWSFDLHAGDYTIDGNGGHTDRNWIFRHETASFLDGVRAGALPSAMADLDEAVATQRAMDAIRQSYDRREVVTVEAEPSGYKNTETL